MGQITRLERVCQNENLIPKTFNRRPGQLRLGGKTGCLNPRMEMLKLE
jgi:hypothetical protein